MEEIPKTHPRYLSLIIRQKISQAMKDGLVHETGLIAHGRGEAFDYLLEEKTNDFALEAEKIASAALILAENPIISINGNVAALVAEDCINLSESIPANLEVNLFHRSKKRVDKIINLLKNNGAKKVYGQKADAKIVYPPYTKYNLASLSHSFAISSAISLPSSAVIFGNSVELFMLYLRASESKQP